MGLKCERGEKSELEVVFKIAIKGSHNMIQLLPVAQVAEKSPVAFRECCECACEPKCYSWIFLFLNFVLLI